MWPDALSPHLDLYMSDYRRTARQVYNKRNVNVIHQETCPCCGRKLVNLYLGDTVVFEKYADDTIRKTVQEWRCKACWDKENPEN